MRWPKLEVLRIEALSDEDVLLELESIMEGRNYSWHSINEQMQAELDKGALEFTAEDGDVLFEWNNLCDEKRNWEREGHFSLSYADFNRDCLINLKIIPTKAGLGSKGKQFRLRFNVWQPDKLGSQLVSANLDKPDLLTKDLWVAPELWEDQGDRRLSANHDSSSSNSEYYEVEEGGEYEADEYEDDEYEDGEYEDSEYVLFE